MTKIHFSVFTIGLVLALHLLQSCKLRGSRSEGSETTQFEDLPAAVPRPVSPKMCVAFRGNGNYAFAHWGALARLIEDYGPVEGVAGGSSGSVNAFFYENLYRSHAAWKCQGGERACTPEETSLRMSLMLKSFLPLLAAFKEFSSVDSMLTGRNKLIFGLKFKSIQSRVNDGDWLEALKAIRSVTEKPEFSNLINPGLKADISAAIPPELSESEDGSISPDQKSKNENTAKQVVLDIVGATDALQWKIDNNLVLFRRGMLNMDNLVNAAGVLADFYAGVVPDSLKELQIFLDGCAGNSRGASWQQIASSLKQPSIALGASPEPSNETCGERFDLVARNYFERIFTSTEDGANISFAYAARSIEAPVGKFLPVVAINSFFDNANALKVFNEANNKFANRQESQVGMVFSFEWLKFGYFAAESDLGKLQSGAQGRNFDLKSKKFASLGERKWKEILSLSPREPGLDSTQCLRKEGSSNEEGEWVGVRDVTDISKECLKISTGGWADLEPVEVLKDVGCKSVVYIQRAGGPTQYAEKLVTFLSMTSETKEALEKLYSLENPKSSYSRNLDAADGVVCTNWESIEAKSIRCMFEHGYDAKIQTNSPDLLSKQLLRTDASSASRIDGTNMTYGCRAGANKASLKALKKVDCSNQVEEQP